MKKNLAISVLLGASFAAGASWKALIVDAAGGGGGPKGNGDVNGDGLLNLSDAIYILEHLYLGGPVVVPFECPPPSPVALPATGQTSCYDQEGYEIDCSIPSLPGQDGSYQTGCPMSGRFMDNGDGTVTDACTGLMWEQDSGIGTLTWEQALRYCEGLELGGRTDWRLPNVRELQSIVEYGRSDPAIDPLFVSESDWYWSSSSYLDAPGFAWTVDFYDGYVDSDYTDSEYSVRPVCNTS